MQISRHPYYSHEHLLRELRCALLQKRRGDGGDIPSPLAQQQARSRLHCGYGRSRQGLASNYSRCRVRRTAPLRSHCRRHPPFFGRPAPGICVPQQAQPAQTGRWKAVGSAIRRFRMDGMAVATLSETVSGLLKRQRIGVFDARRSARSPRRHDLVRICHRWNTCCPTRR
jgi:hypothetical protein